MTPSDFSHAIPRRLDDPPKFLFWERDVAFIALMGFLVGLAVDLQLLGLVSGIGMALGYSKLKAGKHPGMAAHLMSWVTGIPAFKELPPSYCRELEG